MGGPISDFFKADHVRLDALLEAAVSTPGTVDPAPFAAFRGGILRHIAWEEKILLKAARDARSGEPVEARSGEPVEPRSGSVGYLALAGVPLARRLRIDHGAIALLLVPTPTPEIVAELRSILGPHNEIEEGAGGLYDLCEELLADRAEEILERVRAYPDVKLNPHRDDPGGIRCAKDALEMSARQFERRDRR